MSPEDKVSNPNPFKKNFRLLLDLLSPSGFGLLIYGTIFILIILLSQNSGAKKLIENVNFNQFRDTFLGRYINEVDKYLNYPLANTITIYAFWTIIAILVYYTGYRLYKSEHELNRNIKVMGYVRPKGTSKNKSLREYLERLLIRIFAVVFLYLYLKTILPNFSNLIKNNNLNFSLSLNFLIILLKLLVFEFLVFHITVILIRLILLKRRIIYS